MKTSKINYAVVGVFVIAMVTALVGVIVTLSGRTGATDDYYAVYKNVTGVKFGTQVLYEGYPIGQVEEVTPVAVNGGMRFRVDFAVNEGWKIPDDSSAQIRAPGLLSAITISIEAGTSKVALKPGAEVTSKEAANIFAVMSSVAGDISNLAQTSIKPMLANLDRTVTVFGDLLEKDGQRLVGEVIAMIGDINQRIPKIAGNIETFSGDMSKASNELRAFLTPENRKALEDMVANLSASAGQIEKLVTTADELIRNANGVVSQTGGLVNNTNTLVTDTKGVVTENREKINATLADLHYVTESMSRHIDSINQNLEGTARNMYEFSRQIRKNPGLLLGGKAPRDQAKVR